MIVKIRPSQAKLLKHTCAVFELECNIYTIESNGLLVQAEIMHEGEIEISPDVAWHLCTMLLENTVPEIKG